MPNSVVSRDAWLTARKQLLAKEKAFTRMRDELNAERVALPWVKVEKTYVFDGPNGPRNPRATCSMAAASSSSSTSCSVPTGPKAASGARSRSTRSAAPWCIWRITT